jgi:hypothetical protein
MFNCQLFDIPPLHLTFCTPTKSNLYFYNFPTTDLIVPTLQIHLTFQIPNLMSFFHCLGHAKESFQVWGVLKYFISYTRLHLVLRLKNEWSYNPFLQYTFMAWCSVKKSTETTVPLPYYFLYSKGLFALCPTPSLRTTLCQLSVTAYSIYSQLPSISGGLLLHPQPEDIHCHGDKGPTWHGCPFLHYLNISSLCKLVFVCCEHIFSIIHKSLARFLVWFLYYIPNIISFLFVHSIWFVCFNL